MKKLAYSVVGLYLLLLLLVATGHTSAAAWVTMVTVLLMVFKEHQTGVGKTPVVLVGFGVMLLIAYAGGVDFKSAEFKASMNAVLVGHFGIVLFLKSAMQQVKVMEKYSLFDLIQDRISKLGLSDRKQMLVLVSLSGIASAFLDNMTAGMLFGTLAALFFNGHVLLIVQGAIICMTNIVGAPSVIGDIPSVMLWMAGKVTPTGLLMHAGAPALAMAIVVLLWTYFVIGDKWPQTQEPRPEYVPMIIQEKWVIGVTFATFFLPILFNQLFEYPAWGLVWGVGISWAIVQCLQKVLPAHGTRLQIDIEKQITTLIDMSTLMFFVGILGCVAVLEWMHQLESLMHSINIVIALAGITNPYQQVLIVCVCLGYLSAFLDNIPLVAIAIPMIHSEDQAVWALLAITAGTGGSMLITGSASGVVMMNINKGLTSEVYLRSTGKMAFTVFHVGIAVWCIQHWRLLVG